MRFLIVLLPALMLACDPDEGPNGDDTDSNDNTDTSDTSTTDTDTDTTDTDAPDDFSNNWSGSDNYGPAPSRAADQVIYGDLADGETLSSLSWGESGTIACWAVPAASYTGAHVFHTLDQPQQRDFYVRLTPNQGLDMSLYVMQRSEGSTTEPPDATLGGGGDCDGAYDSNGNASQPEVACVASFTGYAYSVLIGVAGAGGLTSGKYKLEIWDNSYSGCVSPNG